MYSDDSLWELVYTRKVTHNNRKYLVMLERREETGSDLVFMVASLVVDHYLFRDKTTTGQNYDHRKHGYGIRNRSGKFKAPCRAKAAGGLGGGTGLASDIVYVGQKAP